MTTRHGVYNTGHVRFRESSFDINESLCILGVVSDEVPAGVKYAKILRPVRQIPPYINPPCWTSLSLMIFIAFLLNRIGGEWHIDGCVFREEWVERLGQKKLGRND